MAWKICLPVTACLLAVLGSVSGQEKAKSPSNAEQRLAIETRLAAITKETVAVEKKLAGLPPLTTVCVDDEWRIHELIAEGTLKLQELEDTGRNPAKAAALKKELEQYTHAREFLAAERKKRFQSPHFALYQQLLELAQERARLELDLKSLWE